MQLATITPKTSILRLGYRTKLDSFDAFVLPEDVPLYHGSANLNLARSNPPFPVGPERYDPTSHSKKVQVSYYSSIDVAKFYAGINGNIYAFRTKRRINLFHLTVENLKMIWPFMPENVKATMNKLYKYVPGNTVLTRPKGSVTDASWVVWLNEYLNSLFDGIFVDRLWRDEATKDMSLLSASQDEVILFDATDSLRRDITDSLDWQFNPFLHLPPVLHELKMLMERFSTTNTSFHAGDLWRHSTWTCLWAERIIDILGLQCNIDIKVLSALALIHDIGKCNPDACERRKDSFYYYNQPQHPKMGKEFILKERPFPVDMDALLAYLFEGKLTPEEVGFVVESHWDLGPVLSAWVRQNKQHSIITRYADQHKGVSEKMVKYLFFTSVADILAAQPPNRQVTMENIASRYWPITNLPRQYKGDQVMENRVGITDLQDVSLFYRQLFPTDDQRMEIP